MSISPVLFFLLVIPLCVQWLFMLYVWKQNMISTKEKMLWIFVLATFPLISIPVYFIHRSYKMSIQERKTR